MSRVNKEKLIDDFKKIGLDKGDVVLIRADLGAVGRLIGGVDTFIDALLDVVGEEGTVVSLSFTHGSFFRRPKKENAFHLKKESYAGALPNAMIKRRNAFRSKHPMCSYVAIGNLAEKIIENHDENSLAYEPVRKIIQLKGKNLLVGCVSSSPGFTTTHLAEADLGMLKLTIFSKFVSTYFTDTNGNLKIFRRTDLGLCSRSFYKFYAHYVSHGILKTEFIGNAYSILAPALDCYNLERDILSNNKKFNVCENNECFTCNMNRWDRLYCAPGFLFRNLVRKVKNIFKK